MGERQLARIGLNQPAMDACRKNEFKFGKDLLQRTRGELVHLLDLSGCDVDEIMDTVCERVCPKPVSVSALMQEQRANGGGFLSTGLPELDKVLLGGLPHGGITELVGAAGAGKTQFCLQSCVMALQEPFHSAIYIDTEQRFSTDRLMEMASYRLGNAQGVYEKIHSMAERCLVFKATSTEDLMKILESLSEVIIEKNVGLIVVDSVAAIVRREFSHQSLVKRQGVLAKEAQILKQLAETFFIPVIVSNQVTTRFGGASSGGGAGPDLDGDSFLTAALGTVWSHCVNTRLVLEKSSATPSITVAKSPACAVTSLGYEIASQGVTLTSGPVLEPDNFWQRGISASFAAPRSNRSVNQTPLGGGEQ